MDKFTEVSLKILKESLNVKNNEKIGLVIDHNSKIVNGFVKAFESLSLKYKIIKIPLKRENSSPIPKVKDELLKCDVIIAPTKNSITHSKEITLARKKGIRIVTLPGIYDELFLNILKTNLNEIDKLNHKVYSKVKNSKQIIIKTKTGTNLTVNLDNKRKWVLDSSKINKREVGNLPCGEVFVAPLENGTNGVINIDGWKKIKIKDKAKIYVKNGKIIGYNKNGKKYYNYLKKSGENSLIIAELGIGTNKSHKKLVGNILHDEKIYKSCHIAFGMNTSFYGKNNAKVHEDVILINPKVLVDRKKFEY